jgi:hypothetical protein
LNSSVRHYLKTAVPGTSNRSYSNFAVQKIELKNKKERLEKKKIGRFFCRTIRWQKIDKSELQTFCEGKVQQVSFI